MGRFDEVKLDEKLSRREGDALLVDAQRRFTTL
jgi:hypothetical protein